MNKTNVDQALAALADALKSQHDENPLANPDAFIKRLPRRSLSGDHISGGKIANFSSAGITDTATKEQINIIDDRVTVKTLAVGKVTGDLTVSGNIKSTTIVSNSIEVDVLTVKDLRADIKFEKNSPVIFSGEINNKGLLWTGVGHTKQFVFNIKPDRFFSSEIIDIAKGKSLNIGGNPVITETELSPQIVKSNLREIGKLKGLLVDGSVNINNHLFYNGTTDRLGIGTDEPKYMFGLLDEGIELILGVKDAKGVLGTFASHGFDILTDNTSRISISAGGNIQLGNPKSLPIQVSVHGKMSVRVSNPDPDVDLHVNGPIKFSGKLQKYDKSFPTSGSYNTGDIIWNAEPKINSYVGWICTRAGSPGEWAPFGKIGNQ
jgi:hypothetical protein